MKREDRRLSAGQSQQRWSSSISDLCARATALAAHGTSCVDACSRETECSPFSSSCLSGRMQRDVNVARESNVTNIREQLEERERQILAPQAAKSGDTRGRLRPEPEDPIRPAFQRDRDRVIHCKAFRRLKHKTQVFFAPTGDHYRTRLTHTLEVSQIARSIAKVLRLNEELTEAIALGHDLGHTPFGHAGERVLSDLIPGGFNHYEQSLRIVDVLENDRAGLNLTWEVRDGIARHSKGKSGMPVGADRRASREHDRRPDRAGRRHHRLRQSRYRRCGESGIAERRGPAVGRVSRFSARARPSASAGWSPMLSCRASRAA